MTIAAFALAEAAVAEPASEPVRKTPPKRRAIARRDATATAEPR